MYPHDSRQLSFENLLLPFSGKLSQTNRWVKLAEIVPWDEAEAKYRLNFAKSGQGAPAKSCRMALGALIIQIRLGCTDRDLVDLILESPYLQFFIGLEEFTDEPPFTPSSLVGFRKRFSMESVNELSEIVVCKGIDLSSSEDPTEENNSGDSPSGSGSNHGKLLIDATCAPADITFPTDLKVLGTARENLEEVLDVLWTKHKLPGKKPRDKRKNARASFLSAAKSKNLSGKNRRRAIRKQLGCIERNLGFVDKYLQTHPDALTCLNKRQYKNLLVASTVAEQQREMWDGKVNRVDDRIVSNSQPHVRPIVRGKVGKRTEFGAVVSVSVVKGFTLLHRFGWEKYNESNDLPGQCEEYRRIFGHYPESVHADKIYSTKINRAWCAEKGIRLSGPALGRPPKDMELAESKRKQQIQDMRDRIPVEGKFGQCKRKYGLDRVMGKLAQTSATMIAMTFFVVNLMKCLAAFLFVRFFAVLAFANAEDQESSQCLFDKRRRIPVWHPFNIKVARPLNWA